MPMSRGERESLIEQYARGPARLREALAKAPREALQWRPEPGRWSVHEVVVHCADSEANAALRIRYLVAEKEPLIVGYDQDAWSRLFDYSAEDWLRIYAAHLEGHARQIERNGEAWTARPSSR